jgi:histidyl-tRNA synthetase
MITTYLKSASIDETMRIIDKLQKLKKNEVTELLKKKIGVSEERAIKFIELLSKSCTKKRVYNVIDEVGYSGPLTSVFDSLSDMGVRSKLDLSIVRGLDYYDGIVFEIYDVENLDIGALCGGGTYNRLPKIFGSNLTAVGAAGGVERLILSLEKHGKCPWEKKKLKTVYIAVIEKNVINYAFKIAGIIRKKGLSCDINLSEKKLKKQLEAASKKGIDYVIIIGSNEANNSTVTIRDMKKEKQETINFGELESYLNKVIDE